MTRMRSPNYPGIPLKQAIDLAEKIFKADRTNVIDKDVAAEHMGYSGLTGRTLKLMGALSQFGLLDKVGKGNVRVSKTAVSILYGTDDKERKEALAVAAGTPTLFRRIRDTFDNPSDKTITSFLMKEGFTDTAVGPVIKSYTETNSYLAQQGVTESHGGAAGADAESDPEDEDQEDDDMEQATEQPPAGTQKPGVKPGGVRFVSNGPLDFNYSSSGLELLGRTNSASELNAFIAKLQLLATMLPDETPTEGTEH
jgi:hypothetical protein